MMLRRERERIGDGHIGETFELREEPVRGWFAGHLFILVDSPGMVVARPREGGCAGTQTGARRKRKACGRSARPRARVLATTFCRPRARAEQAAASIVERFEGRWVERDGKRCRVVGRGAQGGVRIVGGPDGFRERSVSLADIGWVLAARQNVRDVWRRAG